MASSAPPGARRLAKEIKQLQGKPPDGISLLSADDMRRWLVCLCGAPDTLYEGETFTLQFVFGDDYPMGAPEVTFVGESTPVHTHIYSNGHICLSLLADDWSPALTVSSLSVSIQSMLSSATAKKLPKDNSSYVKRYSGSSPKDTKWSECGQCTSACAPCLLA
jgi:ubiquitin-conjugating enzyme E2 W